MIRLLLEGRDNILVSEGQGRCIVSVSFSYYREYLLVRGHES